jgi:hypothetical protein
MRQTIAAALFRGDKITWGDHTGIMRVTRVRLNGITATVWTIGNQWPWVRVRQTPADTEVWVYP